MPTSYPNSTQRFPNAVPAMRSDPPTESTWIMQVWDTLEAIQDALGATPGGAYVTVKGWLTALSNGTAITALNANKLTGSVINTGSAQLEFDQTLYTRNNFIADGTITAVQYLRAGNGGGNPAFKMQSYGGRLDANGISTVAHNLSDLPRRVLLTSFGYRGNSGEYVPISVQEGVAIDGSNIMLRMHPERVTPAASVYGNRAWKGAILYAEAPWTGWT